VNCRLNRNSSRVFDHVFVTRKCQQAVGYRQVLRRHRLAAGLSQEQLVSLDTDFGGVVLLPVAGNATLRSKGRYHGRRHCLHLCDITGDHSLD
jgi:hypothetical protein